MKYEKTISIKNGETCALFEYKNCESASVYNNHGVYNLQAIGDMYY